LTFVFGDERERDIYSKKAAVPRERRRRSSRKLWKGMAWT
jgi:hypothetical protein